jgi:hypothetical protein
MDSGSTATVDEVRAMGRDRNKEASCLRVIKEPLVMASKLPWLLHYPVKCGPLFCFNPMAEVHCLPSLVFSI